MDWMEKFRELMSTFDLFPDGETPAQIAGAPEAPQIGETCGAAVAPSPATTGTGHGIAPDQCRMMNRWMATRMIQQANLDSIARISKEEISSGDGLASDEDVSMDWMLKFMDIAGGISDKSMQTILGKILATEVKTPGHTSLRSLFQVANLSREDIELFTSFSKYVLTIGRDQLFLNDKDFNDRHSMRYEGLLRLEDCRLVNASGTLSWNNTLFVSKALLVSYGTEALAILGKEDGQKISIPVFTLKETGKALWPLIKKEYDPQYLKDVREYFSQNHKDWNILHIENQGLDP